MNSRRFFSSISHPFILDREQRSHFLSIRTDTYILITNLCMSYDIDSYLILCILYYSFIFIVQTLNAREEEEN